MGKEFVRRTISGRGQREILSIPMSFETGEQAAVRVYFQYRVRVTKIRAIATKAIAATDNGTITAANASGAMTSGVVTFTASSAINTEPTAASPTGANTVIDGGSYIQLTAAKTTAGGKCQVTVEYERS